MRMYFVEACFDPDTFFDIQKTADKAQRYGKQASIEFDEIRLIFFPEQKVSIHALYSGVSETVNTVDLLRELEIRSGHTSPKPLA